MKITISLFLIGILLLCGLGACSYNELSPTALDNNVNQTYFDLVLIAPSIFSNELQPLIQHKNTHNVKTMLKTTEEIYQEYTGIDQAEQIKYFIKDAIESYNAHYVLLVGGRKGQSFQWHIPVRYANVDDEFMDKQILTDLYFADIYKENGAFEDWDSNGNGIFAEFNRMFPDDNMDLFPDVCLGRLPCRDTQEVTAIVEKIISYENNAYGHKWFKNILLVGGDTNPGIGEPFPYEGEVACDWVLNYLEDFNPTKLYVSDGSITGASDFINAFNNGNGFVYFSGHGLPNELKTFYPDSQEEIQIFHSDYISELTNNDMYPVMIVGCCLTTNFDVGLFDFLKIFQNMDHYHSFSYCKYSCVTRCIGWNMVKKPDGGSIAHIGSSSTAWGVPGDNNRDNIPDCAQTGFTSGLCSEFFRIYGEENTTILGEIFSDTLTNIIQDFNGQKDKLQCKCIQEFQLIGDPSLKIGGYP